MSERGKVDSDSVFLHYLIHECFQCWREIKMTEMVTYWSDSKMCDSLVPRKHLCLKAVSQKVLCAFCKSVVNFHQFTLPPEYLNGGNSVILLTSQFCIPKWKSTLMCPDKERLQLHSLHMQNVSFALVEVHWNNTWVMILSILKNLLCSN